MFLCTIPECISTYFLVKQLPGKTIAQLHFHSTQIQVQEVVYEK